MTSTARVALTAELASLATPIGLAKERILPVVEPLAALLTEGALVRGRSLGVAGSAAPSLALALCVAACDEGAWLAVIDLPTIGLEAAAELGLPLERVVRVDSGDRRRNPSQWAEIVAAAVDGFELIVTTPPPRATPSVLRRLQTRVQHRGAVLLMLGVTGQDAVDVVIRASAPEWEGAGEGHGHLHARRLHVEATGRRTPRPRHGELWLPNSRGGVAIADAATDDHTAPLPRPVLHSVS